MPGKWWGTPAPAAAKTTHFCGTAPTGCVTSARFSCPVPVGTWHTRNDVKGKDMNSKFDELTKDLGQSVTRRGALKKFSVGVAGMALASFLALSSSAADAKTQTSTVFDAAGDALFPFDLYNAPVPPYLDILRVSVSSSRGVFHFEI